MRDEDDFVLSGMDDADDVPEGDSGILEHHATDWNGLRIVRNGCCTIIKFNGATLTDDVCLAMYRDHVYELIKDPVCEMVRFDFSGVDFLPSGMLGLLTSVKKHGVDVEVTNASDTILELLGVTHLDQLVRISD